MPQSGTLIGVSVDDLQVGPKEGLNLASGLGFRIVEMAASGEISPRELSSSGRRHLKRYASGLGLEIGVVSVVSCAEASSLAQRLDQQLQESKEILELAVDLNVQRVAVPLGTFNLKDGAESAQVREALAQMADHADRTGRIMAIETIMDSAPLLRELLRELDCPHLKLCYDPGRLIMDGLDALGPIEELADQIALSHVRDATRGGSGRTGREVNFGQGQLDLEAYLAYLDQAGYRGPQIIRRSESNRPAEDLKACKEYLEQVMGHGP